MRGKVDSPARKGGVSLLESATGGEPPRPSGRGYDISDTQVYACHTRFTGPLPLPGPRFFLSKHRWAGFLAVSGVLLAVFSALAQAAGPPDPIPAGWKGWFNGLNTVEILWVIFGFAGQGCFMMRFVWQWLVSEKRGHVVIPLPFWYFSLMGGAMLFIYATHRRDPVFMVAQALGITIYIRNLMLIYRPKDKQDTSGSHPGETPSPESYADSKAKPDLENIEKQPEEPVAMP